MKSHDQSHDRSNLIGTISYYNSSQGCISYSSPDLPNLTFQITFQINLSNQPFESTYTINLLAAPRACGTLLFLTNERMSEGVLLPPEVRMI